jgi:guanylate kinase
MLYLISGPSGAGKSTLVKALEESEPDLVFSISTTTRPRRRGEMGGVQYDFVDDEAFDRLLAAEAFVEWANVHDHRYGTRQDHLREIMARGRIPLLDLDVQGGLRVIGLYGPEVISVFLFPPSWAELERRLRLRRTDDEETLRKRLENARWEVGFAERYDYFVVNDVVEEAVLRMRAILTAEKCRRARLGAPPLRSDIPV